MTTICVNSDGPNLSLLRYLLRIVAMQASATRSKPPASVYQKVFDSRKRRVLGLCQRNGN